jgi:hypothetical protein
MTHTIEEAKKKVCYFSISTGVWEECCADGCMAWETDLSSVDTSAVGKEGEVERPEGDGWKWDCFGVPKDPTLGQWTRPAEGDKRYGRCIELDKY